MTNLRLKLSRSDDEPGELEDLDKWTQTLGKSLIPPLIDAEPVTDKLLVAPPDKKRFKLNVMTSGDTEFKNLAEDTSCGKFPLGQWAKLKFTQTALPLEDVFVGIDEDAVKDMLKGTRLDLVLPSANVPFPNPAADAGLTRQAFYGLASHLVEEIKRDEAAPDGAVFKVDLMVMKDFEVRHGFARYGACAYFDADQKPVAVRNAKEQLLTPTDGYKWEVAKFAWRVSLNTWVTAVDHLYNLHFTVAAQMLRASREALSAKHPLKRALEPFLMRTALINNKAGTALLPKNSILHHISGFTWKSLCAVAAATYQQGNEWEGLETTMGGMGPAMKQMIEDGKIPFYQDGLDLYKCFKAYFDSILADDAHTDPEIQDLWKLLGDYTGASKLGYLTDLTRESLLEILGTFAFRVTGGHEHVGTIREHVETPVHGAFRITHNAVEADKQGFVGVNILLAMTSLRTPALLSTFETYWETDEEREKWGKLQEELKVLTATIDERNKTRPYVFENCNPSFLECAVSI